MRDGRVLAAQRSAPPALAGRWEFPGGKVEPGETPEEALHRECREELGLSVQVGPVLAPDVALPDGRALRLYACTSFDEPLPAAGDGPAVQMLTDRDLDQVLWVEADQQFLPAVRGLLPQC